jgi:hypothetical protein
MALYDDLLKHFGRFPSAPFLFIGAGLGRRYLALEDWTGLLRHFAEVVGNDYDYYSATANGDPAKIASLLAADLHERWWKTDEFAETKKLYEGKVHTAESGLKAEVARRTAESVDRLSDDAMHVEELALLKKAVVDGVITTNYDPLPELVWPDFRVYVGQDELLFADLQGVGETYKIHGSHEEPDSIVLTRADFERFGERNPYLAAKLLTIFVEHPIVFLGYSLSDPNITRILRSIAAVLTTERVKELQDRLLFVQWNPDATDPRILGTAVVADGFTIPVLTVEVSDFREIFSALGALDRKLPARVLRQLKEQVFELVRDNDPNGRLYVQDLTADVDASEVDVVFGVGAIEKFTTSYKGKSRSDLIDDVLADGDLDAARVIDEVIPPFRRDMHVPIYKYLRGAGLLKADGTLKASADVDQRVAKRVEQGVSKLGPQAGRAKAAKEAVQQAGDFATLLNEHPDAYHVLSFIGALPLDAIDPDDLRDFLVTHRHDQFVDGHNLMATQWVKGVCLYDYLRYAKKSEGDGSKPKPKPKSKPKAKNPLAHRPSGKAGGRARRGKG